MCDLMRILDDNVSGFILYEKSFVTKDKKVFATWTPLIQRPCGQDDENEIERAKVWTKKECVIRVIYL